MDRSSIVLLGFLAAMLPSAAAAQEPFDAVVPVGIPDPSIAGCLYNTVNSTILASVVVPPAGPVDLTLRFQPIPLQRTYANPLCPAARNLLPAEYRLSVPRNASTFVQYQYERNGPATDILGTGETGNAHLAIWVYFCAEDGAATCTWTPHRTNRVLVSLYYRFDRSSPSSIIRFAGQYLGPNPGRLTPPTIAAPASLPAAIVGAPYAPVMFTASGGAPPYTWSSSALPPGLQLTPAGVLSGTGSGAEHRYAIEIRLRDGFGQTATRSYSLTLTTSACTRDGCLASATRQRLVSALPPPDGCSVPANYHLLGVPVPLRLIAAPYVFLFKSACDEHDLAYSSYAPYEEFATRRETADQLFLRDMLNICGGIPALFRSTCVAVAAGFQQAVVRFGEEHYLNAQLRESFCPDCVGLPSDVPADAGVNAAVPADPGAATRLDRGISRAGRGNLSAPGTAPAAAVHAYGDVSGQFYIRTSPTTIDDAIRLDGVELVERSTTAFARYQIPPQPLPAEGVTDFAFAVLGQGDGDWLSVTLDGAVLWSGQTAHYEPDVVYLAHIPAASLSAGGSLQFTLHGVGAHNAVLLIGDPDRVLFGFGEPDAPRNVRASVDGGSVTIAWDPATPPPTHYVLEAALSPRGPAVARLALGQSTTLTTSAPPGRYWVRVLAVNEIGESRPSSEVEVLVASCSPPVAPQMFDATAAGPVATLTWSTAPGASYTLEVGTSPGASNLGTVSLPASGHFSAAAPAGTYYVRLRASNACGVSAPSVERAVRLEGN